MERPTYLPIEEYGVIGDLHTAALVSTDASIDFLCFPRFDSPTIFAALLDRRRGGYFELAPVLDDAKPKQLYLADTNVLLSRFLSHEGVAEISDFMPVEQDRDSRAHNVVRRAKTVRGRVRFRMVCAPRFDYGRADHQLELEADGREALFTSRGADQTVLRLFSGVPLRVVDGAAVAEFELDAGETCAFILDDGRATATPCRHPRYVAESFKRTVNFWRGWIGRSSYQGRWRETINRSALTLKLLTSFEHGSMVAAPTLGLPEIVGGGRNWDYRFTWIRDASFTLYAFLRLGLKSEAAAFMGWIEKRCADIDGDGDGGLQVMYGIDGRRDLPETTLDHFEGYRGSRPVRIGNAAASQLQLDIYGELMDTVYLYDRYAEPIHHDLWMSLVKLIDWVSDNWRRPDEGIWEVRGGRHEFLYSRLMCWVALDRAIRIARHRSFPAPLDRWLPVRDAIYRDVFDNFWSPERRAFVQYKGSSALDASSLLMPLVKFISPTDPRWLAALSAIEGDLVEDSLVYRYRPEHAARDGLEGVEGTFSMCSFWYVECLTRSGDLHRARLAFDKMLGYANHLGLYGEELGPRGEHLGNYPQAFTHIALVSAGYNLDRRLDEAGVRG